MARQIDRPGGAQIDHRMRRHRDHESPALSEPRLHFEVITVIVNGQEHRLEHPCTVEGLLVAIGKTKAVCAVEVNQTLVPKRLHKDRPLAEGDKVEIVTLVGGG